MANKKEFLKVYNDYSAIESKENSNIKTLYHFTNSPKAVIGICNGDQSHGPHFRATILKDFWDEENDLEEGRLFIGYLKDYFNDNPNDPLKYNVLKSLNNECENNEYNLDSILGEIHTGVLCTCLNSDLDNMWENYAGVQQKDAFGYKLVIDKEKFLESLYIEVNNEPKKKNAFGEPIFRFTPIVYDGNEQKDIIKEFVEEFLETSDINNLSEMDQVRYLLLHSEFLSIAFKNGDKFKWEEEYRIWVNIANPGKNGELDKKVPKIESTDYESGKRYYSFYFDPKAISGIVCWNEEAKKKIENDIPEDIKVT